MWIDRKITPLLQKAVEQFPVVVLTGARQTGKTSLLTRQFPSYQYVSLEDSLVAELAEKETEEFLQRYPRPLIIDEVQYAPGLFRKLKSVVDASRHTMGQILLTGSQKFVLMKEVTETLAGRCGVLELLPLSCEELRDANILGPSDASNVYRHLIRGYAPELWRNPDADTGLHYSAYLGSYLERDVRQLLNVGSLRDFDRFIRACALRSGNLLNKSELAKDVGVTVNTVNSWLSVLEASNQISLLEPYFDNQRKQLVKSPKLFFLDPGFLSYMLGLDESSIARYPNIGQIWETLIFAELAKLRSQSAQPMHLWFYNEHKKMELDFVVDKGALLYPIEVKFASEPDTAVLKSIKKFQRDYANKLGTPYLACRIPQAITRQEVSYVHGFDLTSRLRTALGM